MDAAEQTLAQLYAATLDEMRGIRDQVLADNKEANAQLVEIVRGYRESANAAQGWLTKEVLDIKAQLDHEARERPARQLVIDTKLDSVNERQHRMEKLMIVLIGVLILVAAFLYFKVTR